MGVEALIRDRSRPRPRIGRVTQPMQHSRGRAREGDAATRRLSSCEAIAEILAGTRVIHCHSYRQDEIFMLVRHRQGARLQDRHVPARARGLQGRRRDQANALGASSFSDWWAYKMEVQDAIPDNGAILHEAGVVVSFNSDSNEHARRLNSEAGKAVKYGGVAPEQALAFVTSEPGEAARHLRAHGLADRRQGRRHRVVVRGPARLRGRVRDDVGRRAAHVLARARRRAAAFDPEGTAAPAAARAGRRQGRTAREGDPKDAYWAAEDLTEDYCCRNCEGGR
jgi:hypothetical protein